MYIYLVYIFIYEKFFNGGVLQLLTRIKIFCSIIIMLNVLHNYFDDLTKLFPDLCCCELNF